MTPIDTDLDELPTLEYYDSSQLQQRRTLSELKAGRTLLEALSLRTHLPLRVALTLITTRQTQR